MPNFVRRFGYQFEGYKLLGFLRTNPLTTNH